jgi:hypothetical protein
MTSFQSSKSERQIRKYRTYPSFWLMSIVRITDCISITCPFAFEITMVIYPVKPYQSEIWHQMSFSRLVHCPYEFHSRHNSLFYYHLAGTNCLKGFNSDFSPGYILLSFPELSLGMTKFIVASTEVCQGDRPALLSHYLKVFNAKPLNLRNHSVVSIPSFNIAKCQEIDSRLYFLRQIGTLVNWLKPLDWFIK